MKYNGSLDIATGRTADSKIWSNKKFTWAELVQKLSEGHKTPETFQEYKASTKAEQSKIKDVGGYVGGYLRNGRRKPENIVHRSILTLDIDFAHGEFWDDFQMQYENAAVLHATHSHHDNSPRYRLVMPLSRSVSPDEYAAISRQVAGCLNIDLFDNTTFETNRLMFWPSSPIDITYYFRFQDGPWVDADEVLASYVDWTDSSLWPTSTHQITKIRTSAEKQEDPENKRGSIGAFCRTYTIQDAIAKYLPEDYIEASDGRYTYTKGTTSSGLVIYEDKFAFSHHGTDPSSGRLCNAFDLVRLHKFGHMDDDHHRGSKKPSFKSMEELVLKDPEVRKIIASENLADAKYDFSDSDEEDAIEVDKDAIDWMQDLEIDGRGRYVSSAPNLNLIFGKDIRLKGLFKHNIFDNKIYVYGNMPWRKVERPEPIKNVDFAGVRNYVESIYGIVGNLKVDDALALEIEKNSFHPITDYLRSVKWDGETRIDEILIKYFGAEDNQYTREAIRKTLVGAVARVFEPGCKFDLVLTLVSQQQGTGKSSFFKALGRQWFSDTFMSVQGKEALEQIQGAWIIEMAELSGIRKAEVEAVKHFISKQEDMFRPAYARTSETFRRQCIFVATTNKDNFLQDSSGNRRFMPIAIHEKRLRDNEPLRGFIENQKEIDQVWAEAYHLYKQKESLYLSRAAEEIAEVEQKRHSEVDIRTGMIENYLGQLLPEDWETRDVYERRVFLEDPLSSNGTVKREYVCVAEIWCECLRRAKDDMDRYKTREINEILRSLDGWKQSKSTKSFGEYGTQRFFERRE